MRDTMPDDRAGSGWTLKVQTPSGVGGKLFLADGSIQTVGRSRKCDLCVPVAKDLGFSRQHCKLAAHADRIAVSHCFEAMVAPVVDGVEVPKGGTADAFNGSSIEMGMVGLSVARAVFVASVGDTAAQERGTVAEGTFATRAQKVEAYPDDGQDGGRTLPIAARPVNTGASTVSTNAQAATRGDKTAGKAANRPTAFVDPKEMLRLLKEDESQKRKKKSPLVFILPVFLIVMAGLAVRSHNKGAGLAWERSTHPWMSLTVPVGWSVRESGRMVCMNGNKAVGGLYTVAGYKEDSPDIRWWDFDHAVATCLKIMADDLPQVNGRTTVEADMIRDNSRQPMIGMIGDISPVAFVSVAGKSGSGRLFLEGSKVVFLFVVCDYDKKVRAQAEKILDSFSVESLLTEQVYIDRRRAVVIMDATIAKATLTDAQFFYANRLVSPDNAWKSYRKALSIWQWVSAGGDASETFSRLDRREVWEILTVAANNLHERFKTYHLDIRKAYSMGDLSKGDQLARELQALIPDRKDYRWTWAEKQLRHGQSVKKKPTGVFSK